MVFEKSARAALRPTSDEAYNHTRPPTQTAFENAICHNGRDRRESRYALKSIAGLTTSCTANATAPSPASHGLLREFFCRAAHTNESS